MTHPGRLLVVGLVFLSSGCSSLIHGPLQTVQIESDPPGATATVTPTLSERGPLFLDSTKSYTVTTPGTVRLRRDNSYRVEVQKPGYKIGTAKLTSSYNWVTAPVWCGPCEFVGDLPENDMKGRSLPVRFLEATFYAYPRGFFRAIGRALRPVSPEAMLGHSFKLRREGAAFTDGWHGLGTPVVATRLEPTAN
jgi:hypothetical protein